MQQASVTKYPLQNILDTGVPASELQNTQFLLLIIGKVFFLNVFLREEKQIIKTRLMKEDKLRLHGNVQGPI